MKLGVVEVGRFGTVEEGSSALQGTRYRTAVVHRNSLHPNPLLRRHHLSALLYAGEYPEQMGMKRRQSCVLDSRTICRLKWLEIVVAGAPLASAADGR